MKTMDSYYGNDALPEGLREALGKNGKALERWSAMTGPERQRAAELLRDKDPGAIQSFVDNLVGWEIGHPPYQL